MSSLQISSHVLEPSGDCPYAITAKCYSSAKTYSVLAREGVSLIVVHAAGMHKECWEPVVERVFAALDSGERYGSVKIRDVWCIDAPNHGEAAVLNEEFLRTNWLEEFPWDELGRAIGRFLTAGPDKGARVDFSQRKLGALGHSMGATALLWLQKSSIPVHFEQIILGEPVVNPPGFDAFPRASFVVPSTHQRRDVWPSRQAALEDLRKSPGYSKWDPRIIELFVAYGLRVHPMSKAAFGPFKGVTLACDRFHEAACYRGVSLGARICPVLAEISQEIPVSVIFGAVEDIVEIALKKAIADPSISNVQFASVHWVEKGGHLVVQDSPQGTAQAIIEIFSKLTPSQPLTSKL